MSDLQIAMGRHFQLTSEVTWTLPKALPVSSRIHILILWSPKKERIGPRGFAALVVAHYSDFDASNAWAEGSVPKTIRLHLREINAMKHRWSDDAVT
jgi:hypothetical protein